VQGTASIRGLVTAADTNSPVRRAQVRATSPETRSSRLSTTDAEGPFRIEGPAGRTLDDFRNQGGFVAQQFGQRHPFESVDPVELAEGQRFTANITLSRGSVSPGASRTNSAIRSPARACRCCGRRFNRADDD
jgi:hypothetical protein